MVTKLEILDTLLRDGIQGVGAKTKSESRRHWFQGMEKFRVPFVEMPLQDTRADSHIEGDIAYCGDRNHGTKVVAFGSTSKNPNPEEDDGMNLLAKCKAPVVCIFGKADPLHVGGQLRRTNKENLYIVRRSVEYLTENGKEVFYDAEHFFDGFKRDPGYALNTLETAAKAGATRLVLCDTNGRSTARRRGRVDGVREIVKAAREYLDSRGIKTPLGVHMHNDKGDALENTIAALEYLRERQNLIHVQGTMNGTGERAGNLNLATLIGNLATAPISRLVMDVDVSQLKAVADAAFLVQALPFPDPDNRPFVGENAFAHKGGVHVDAIKKIGPEAYEFAPPEMFGNKRIFVLNSLGGGSTVELVADSFGMKLDKGESKRRIEKLRRRLDYFEKRGFRLGALRAEQYLLIHDAFGDRRKFFEVSGCRNEDVSVGRKKYSEVDLSLDINGTSARKIVTARGPIDAMFKAYKATLANTYPFVNEVHLVGFDSKIARAHGEESSMRTMVMLSRGGELSETVGVDLNIIESGRDALKHGFRYHIKRHYEQQGRN